MLSKKKKLSKKEIKQDKLVESYYRVRGYFEENRSRLLLYVGALVIVIVAVVFYIQHQKERNTEAAYALSQVVSLYDQGSYLEAIEGRQGEIQGLKYIVEEYGGTENGELAKIYLANSYAMLGKHDEAVKYYEDFDGDNEIFEATALAGEAGYYAYKNDYKKAADLYLQASRVSKENVLNPEYMLKAAINYINSGNEEEAKDLLETIKTDYNTSAAFREVDKYLVQVN